jgi:predicted ATPase
LVLWCLGYPEQARRKIEEGVALAQQLSHPLSSVIAHCLASQFHYFRQDLDATLQHAETAMTLAQEQELPLWSAYVGICRSWVLVKKGHGEEEIEQMRHWLAVSRAIGAEAVRPLFLTMLAEAYLSIGQGEKGLTAVAEALAIVDKAGERMAEAELYRLKGELTRQKLSVVSNQLSVPSPQSLTPSTHAEAEAEACFLQSIEIARQRKAKAWELRTALHLSRLWQTQGRQAEAYQLLSDIYQQFTEGFETAELQAAKCMLQELT